MQWSEVLINQSLQDLPYKIELNEYGQIEMSPATNKHGFYQIKIATLLSHHLSQGEVISECAIQTEKGVKVADVAWLSPNFLRRHSLDETPFSEAPKICIEIISPSNTPEEMQKKMQLYFQQGAQEVWLVNLEGKVKFFDAPGEKGKSAFEVKVQLPNV